VNCPNCIKQGLAILPVRYAVVASDDKLNAAVPPNDKAHAGRAPKKPVDPDVLPLTADQHITRKPLNGSKYILRQLDRGYVYVLYPVRGTRVSRWIVYEVGSDGCMNIYTDPRHVPPKPMDQPLNKTCGWPIHSDSAAQTIAIS
ncbi:toxin VasX, partial [Burkholderia sp. 3C]